MWWPSIILEGWFKLYTIPTLTSINEKELISNLPLTGIDK